MNRDERGDEDTLCVNVVQTSRLRYGVDSFRKNIVFRTLHATNQKTFRTFERDFPIQHLPALDAPKKR